MFQFNFKEKFDVLRMFRLLVSSRIRRVRKCNSIWFYLLYLFIQYLKRIIHQSFVSTYGDSRGKVLDNSFLIVPAVPGKCGGYNIGTLTLLGFSVVEGGAKSRVVTISLFPQG